MVIMNDFSRQQEVFDPDTFTTPITIIGAGATGSWVALFLAKLGIKNITVYDFDEVEIHNLPNQAFGLGDVGRLKVDAIADTIALDTGINIQAKAEKVTKRQRLSGIVFILTDTMSSRREIWEESLRANFNCDLLIETRMGLDGGRIYCIDPQDAFSWKKYEETLYSDEESAVSACGTSQSIVATAVLISSYAVWQLIHYHNGAELDHEILIDAYGNLYTERWS